MGSIVAAAAVPHSPFFPAMVAKETEPSLTSRAFDGVRRQLEAAEPDTIVLFDSDHLNTFFLDNLPTFAVAAASRTTGPNDRTEGLPAYVVDIDEETGRLIHGVGVEAGFDLSLTCEFTVDHSVLVPLHFLTPQMDVPVVPIFINGLVPPLPRSERAFALGRMVADAVAHLPAARRVAVLSSGTVSHEVAGPRIRADAPFGIPDPHWVDEVVAHLQRGDREALVKQATAERMWRAGDVAGELLNLIALLGTLGDDCAADHLTVDESLGHLFATWDVPSGRTS